jgi:ATP-binding cassette subfamily F protein uup
MSSAIYYIKNGILSFGTKHIFSDLELFLNKDDRICLVGKNGSGKSSLMKIICGDYELDDEAHFTLNQIVENRIFAARYENSY